VHSLLLMHIPGEPPRRIDQPVSLLDIAPTLLRVLHLSPNGNFQGRGDILDPKYSAKVRPLFFTIQGLTDADGLLLDEHKYAVDWQRHLRELYDLRTDPGERTNLISTDPETAQKLDTVLRQFLGRQLAYYGIQGWKQGRYPPPAF
jgi:arylsulfatase A-like enzyme